MRAPWRQLQQLELYNVKDVRAPYEPVFQAWEAQQLAVHLQRREAQLPLLQRLLRVPMRPWARLAGPAADPWQFYYLPDWEERRQPSLRTRLLAWLAEASGAELDFAYPRLSDWIDGLDMAAPGELSGGLAQLLGPHGVAFEEGSLRMSQSSIVPSVSFELQRRGAGGAGGEGQAAGGGRGARCTLASHLPGDEYE
jgi:hypothetical protein